MNAISAISWRSLKKIQWGLNLWLTMPVRCSYQQSYEATDVGSRSVVVTSYVTMKEVNVNDVCETNHVWTVERNLNFFRIFYAIAEISIHNYGDHSSFHFISSVHIWCISYTSFTTVNLHDICRDILSGWDYSCIRGGEWTSEILVLINFSSDLKTSTGFVKSLVHLFWAQSVACLVSVSDFPTRVSVSLGF